MNLKAMTIKEKIDLLEQLFEEVDEALHEELPEEEHGQLDIQVNGMDDLRENFGEFITVAQYELVQAKEEE